MHVTPGWGRSPGPATKQQHKYINAGGLPIESGILPLLKHVCGEQRLAIKRSAGVAPEVNLRKHTSNAPPSSANKAGLTFML